MVKSKKKLRKRAALHEKKDEAAVEKVVDGVESLVDFLTFGDDPSGGKVLPASFRQKPKKLPRVKEVTYDAETLLGLRGLMEGVAVDKEKRVSTCEEVLSRSSVVDRMKLMEEKRASKSLAKAHASKSRSKMQRKAKLTEKSIQYREKMESRPVVQKIKRRQKKQWELLARQ